VTTDELIKQVLEHGDDGCFLHGECDTYQSAPLLARKLQRAMSALGAAEVDALQGLPWDSDMYLRVLDELEAMQ